MTIYDIQYIIICDVEYMTIYDIECMIIYDIEYMIIYDIECMIIYDIVRIEKLKMVELLQLYNNETLEPVAWSRFCVLIFCLFLAKH